MLGTENILFSKVPNYFVLAQIQRRTTICSVIYFVLSIVLYIRQPTNIKYVWYSYNLYSKTNFEKNGKYSTQDKGS